MSGAFQTSREIFDNPIWKNIVDFRLFFLIYGKAVFSNDGVRLSEDLILKRGEWCRSIRKIQEDLTYVENRQIKTYSTSVISRCIKRLEESQRICTRLHELGTVFTVVNYEMYQGFGGSKKSNLERNLEQSGNSEGTVGEQSGNNNKNEKKEKNANKVKQDLKESPQFSEFWNMYPRRVGNADALTAWNNVIKRGAEPSEIYKAVENYKINIQQSGTETNFIKHPSSFLNKDRWKDFLKLTVLNGGGNGGKHGRGFAANAGTYNPDEDELNDLYYGSPKPGA